MRIRGQEYVFVLLFKSCFIELFLSSDVYEEDYSELCIQNFNVLEQEGDNLLSYNELLLSLSTSIVRIKLNGYRQDIVNES